MPAWLQKLWFGDSPLALLLLPLSGIFAVATELRRGLYRRGWFSRRKVSVPVVVVGNITVGGTGKTPLVGWLARELGAQGWNVAIISRGYGGNAAAWPQRVDADSDPQQVGDEPVLLARRTAVPVVVAPRRGDAAATAVADGATLLLADDGLQHYALARDCELAVVDGRRGFGNGYLLPAGPLREPLRRLDNVDALLVNGNGELPAGALRFTLEPGAARQVTGARSLMLKEFAAGPVHAVAGIGDPQRFFASLRAAGLTVIEHPFPDHWQYQAADLDFGDAVPVLMTEKDAVKCRAHAAPHHWYVPVDVVLSAEDGSHLLALITAACKRKAG